MAVITLYFKKGVSLIIGIILFSNCIAQDKKAPITVYPLNNPIRTILRIHTLNDTNALNFWCYDFYSGYLQSSDTKLISATPITSKKNDFVIEVDLKYPIYLMPAVRGAAAISPGSVFKNLLSVRYVSYGILIEPGDSIHVDLNSGITEKEIAGFKVEEGVFDEIPFFDKQAYSGKGVEKLWCIQEIIRNTKMYNYPGRSTDLLAFSDSVTQMILNTIQIFKDRLSPAAAEIIKAHYIPMLAFDISEIITNDGISVEKELDINNPLVKKLYNSRLAQINKLIDYNNPDLRYGTFFSNILKKRALLKYAMDSSLDYKEISNKYSVNYYKALVKYLPECPLKDRVLAEYVQKGFTHFGLRKDIEEVTDIFLTTTSKDTPINKLIREHYTRLKVVHGKGGNTYPFELPDTSGKIVRMEDFKGKVILIDFYYFACPGCVQLMPVLTKVQNEFNRTDSVVFISVSIDDDRKSWLAGIGKSATLNSIHLNAKENINHPLIKFYDINAYPQLVLIDKKGKLVTTHAPDPRGDGGNKLINLINQTLNEN